MMIDDRDRRVSSSSVLQRGDVAVTLALIVLANVAVWIWAFLAFNGTTLLGTALLAYLLGLRHAFDADHIAAIDNVVRKLMHDGRRPFAVGLYFSLGHATVVVLASIAVALATSAMKEPLETFHGIGSVVGTLVSSLFLVMVGLVNLVVLRSLWVSYRGVRRGDVGISDAAASETNGGLLARACRPLLHTITQPRQMYPIGFLFGLGFDTASEIGLLGISASQATLGRSVSSILVFPALFTVGMALLDTLDSIMMTGAYAWAFDRPLRKLRYNLAVTATSVVVAFCIGGVEAFALLSEKLGLQGRIWSTLEPLDALLAVSGFVIVGLFAVSWIVSVVVYRATETS